MKCTKCGKDIEKTDKFCQYCGTEVKAEEKKETKVVKTVEKKKEAKEEVKVEKVENNGAATKKGLAIASMILGIIGIVFSWCGLWVVIFPILALIFALCSKKSGFKIAGLITSIVGFVLQIIVTLFAFAALTSLFGIIEEYADDYYDDDYNYNYTYKYATPYGEWTCTPYPESSYTSKDETTLKFNYTGTFIYGPKGELDDNYYSGKFTYTKEYDKNEKYTDKEFIDIKAPVDKFVLKGIEQDASNKNLNMEMEFINDYKEAIIMFYNTSNTYHCKK